VVDIPPRRTKRDPVEDIDDLSIGGRIGARRNWRNE
jgi:hypothetical protein